MVSANEKRIRFGLRAVRLMLGYLPLGMMRGLMTFPLYRVALPDGVRTERVTVGGVPCEWMTNNERPDGPLILYLHGGGFVLGASHLHRKMVAHLITLTGGRALMVDYRLAPEHPFPAALDDCLAVYRAILKDGISPQDTVIVGDSAGGNLTLTTLIAARDARQPLPAAAVCLSPATDLRLHDEVMWTTVPDELLHPRAIRMFRESYIGQGDPDNPLMTPVLADLRGLPPLFLLAGEPEGLRGDIVRLADEAAQQGVPTRLHVEPRMWHVWPLNLPELPQALATLRDIADYIAEHTRQPVTVTK